MVNGAGIKPQFPTTDDNEDDADETPADVVAVGAPMVASPGQSSDSNDDADEDAEAVAEAEAQVDNSARS